jgi:hypothetical protein
MINNTEQPSIRKKVKVIICLCLVILVLVGICSLIWWALNTPYIVLRSVPMLPDAEIRLDGRRAFWGDAGPMAVTIYDTHLPWPEVVRFYKDEMTQQGWILEKEKAVDDVAYGDHFHDVCLVFRQPPIFVANIGILGTSENGVILSGTSVTVDTAPSNRGFCR